MKREESKYPYPVPEKFQRKARLRRIRQQLRDGKISLTFWAKALIAIEADYAERP